MPSPGRRGSQTGFTLVEMLVVLAIVSILTGLAVVYAGEPRPNVRGVGGQLTGAFDAARLRAIATHRWQRARWDVDARKFMLEQATTEGMTEPDDWAQVEVLPVARPVEVYAIAATANATSGEDIPDEGDGLDTEVWFAPDGSSQARTIYLTTTASTRNVARVVVYRVTGSAMLKEGW